MQFNSAYFYFSAVIILLIDKPNCWEHLDCHYQLRLILQLFHHLLMLVWHLVQLWHEIYLVLSYLICYYRLKILRKQWYQILLFIALHYIALHYIYDKSDLIIVPFESRVSVSSIKFSLCNTKVASLSLTCLYMLQALLSSQINALLHRHIRWTHKIWVRSWSTSIFWFFYYSK